VNTKTRKWVRKSQDFKGEKKENKHMRVSLGGATLKTQTRKGGASKRGVRFGRCDQEMSPPEKAGAKETREKRRLGKT